MPHAAIPLLRRVFRAPGRVNLIGEHTDYNGGFAMPAAIGFSTRVSVSFSEDRTILAKSDSFPETCAFALDTLAASVPQDDWSNYIRAVALSLLASGYRIEGANLTISSDVPVGAGLSSSAALEVATALALLANSGITAKPREIATLCQRAENEFVGVRSGIMDQLTSCLGKHGHALLLDCRSLEVKYIPIPNTIRMVVCNSMVHHSLASGEYNRRRAECESARDKLRQVLPQVKDLRDVSIAELDRWATLLTDVELRRCRHVISENRRTVQAAEALQHEDIKRCGELMTQSHGSLRSDYEVSCAELDILVELALPEAGVYGSRMTGGGFGGCTITLVEAPFTEEFVKRMRAGYAQQTGMEAAIYILEAADGAQEIRE